MKKYTKIYVEIYKASDVIATSSDVTTGGVKLPWSTDLPIDASSYELLEVKDLGTASNVLYDN